MTDSYFKNEDSSQLLYLNIIAINDWINKVCTVTEPRFGMNGSAQPEWYRGLPEKPSHPQKAGNRLPTSSSGDMSSLMCPLFHKKVSNVFIPQPALKCFLTETTNNIFRLFITKWLYAFLKRSNSRVQFCCFISSDKNYRRPHPPYSDNDTCLSPQLCCLPLYDKWLIFA